MRVPKSCGARWQAVWAAPEWAAAAAPAAAECGGPGAEAAAQVDCLMRHALQRGQPATATGQASAHASDGSLAWLRLLHAHHGVAPSALQPPEALQRAPLLVTALSRTLGPCARTGAVSRESGLVA